MAQEQGPQLAAKGPLVPSQLLDVARKSLDLAGERLIGLPGGIAVAVGAENVSQDGRIARVGLGVAGTMAIPIAVGGLERNVPTRNRIGSW
jgi:hypothetical protein